MNQTSWRNVLDSNQKVVTDRADQVTQNLVAAIFDQHPNDSKTALRHILTLAVMFQNPNFIATRSRLLSNIATPQEIAKSTMNLCMFPELLSLKNMSMEQAVERIYDTVSVNLDNVTNIHVGVSDLVPVELPIAPLKCGYKGPRTQLIVVPYNDTIYCFDRREFKRLIQARENNPYTGKPFPSELYK